MMRTERAKEGQLIWGTLSWSWSDGSPAGSIGYRAIMDQPGEERLELSFTRGSGEDRENVSQTVRLVSTRPNFGGKRWWMICPFRGIRVGKLYLPPGGDRFASRKAWRLGYQIQRVAHRDRPFEALFKLQRQLGSEQGWGNIIRRPKGMWHRTFDRHWERFLELDERCSVEMADVMGLLDRLRL